MNIATIAELLQTAMPIGLIIIGVGFGLTEAWPYWKLRDTENRAHKAKADLALAGALTAVAGAIEKCPIRPNSETGR